MLLRSIVCFVYRYRAGTHSQVGTRTGTAPYNGSVGPWSRHRYRYRYRFCRDPFHFRQPVLTRLLPVPVVSACTACSPRFVCVLSYLVCCAASVPWLASAPPFVLPVPVSHAFGTILLIPVFLYSSSEDSGWALRFFFVPFLGLLLSFVVVLLLVCLPFLAFFFCWSSLLENKSSSLVGTCASPSSWSSWSPGERYHYLYRYR